MSEPGAACVVHGGGDEISDLQRKLGSEPRFVNGRRITSDDDMELVRMVLSGSANKRLVASLEAAGVRAAGISGEDGGVLSAEPIDAEKFGKSGKPVSARVDLITALLSAGFFPVISPVATNAGSISHEPLNVNGDDAAAMLAGALGAELWLIADVPGVMDSNRAHIESLDQDQVSSLVADGTVTSGMLAKLEAGFEALALGSPDVMIGGIETLSGNASGTRLSLTTNKT